MWTSKRPLVSLFLRRNLFPHLFISKLGTLLRIFSPVTLPNLSSRCLPQQGGGWLEFSSSTVLLFGLPQLSPVTAQAVIFSSASITNLAMRTELALAVVAAMSASQMGCASMLEPTTLYCNRVAQTQPSLNRDAP